MGRIAGIARHAFAKAPIETIDRAAVTLEGGIVGDFRGGVKGKPYKRQVSLIEAGDWAAAMAEVGGDLPWEQRRANLLEVTVETDPCERMNALADGLCDALTPDWRGGVCTMVIAPGEIAVGDEIRIEE
jgi:hypothetical protein